MNTNKRPNLKKDFDNRSNRVNSIKKKLENVPEHIKNIVYVLNNNAEIRRYTSLAMIKTLRESNIVSETDKVYIKFGISKFGIIINGLKTEQFYNSTDLFIDAFASAFPAFAYNAQKLINTFCEIENKDIDSNEVEQTAKSIRDCEAQPVEEEQSTTTAAE